LALKWDDIDFEAASIRLAKTLFYTNGEYLFEKPKTAKSRRSLDKVTLSLMKKWRLRQKEANMAARITSDYYNLVFTRENGDPLRLAYPNDKLDILIKKHNLHPITIHGLRHRHTHASLLFEAGASIKEVQERLGHSDIKMTMNIYTHVTNNLKE
jgi:integrase